MSFKANVVRMAHIAGASFKHGGLYFCERTGLKWGGDEPIPGPIRLRLFLEDLGGSFLKFGQILALQPDILPREYCDALFDLMDRIPAFSYEKVRQTIVEELGRPPEEIFDTFQEKSLATASIGQVHIAWLEGKKVAVKIQRPNAETETAGDIRIMAATVGAIRLFRLKFLEWMVEPMSEFLEWTVEELDYRNEARYMEQIKTNARGKTVEKVPDVYWTYTTARVLVVEFLEGITIVDYMRAVEQNDQVKLARLKKMGFDREQFARNIIGNFLGGSFNYGLFHADLHPANLMILPGNVVGYVDFGITGVISIFSREALISLTLAYTRADIEKMTEIFLNVSSFGKKADPAALKAGLERGAAQWYRMEAGGPVLKTTITRVMLDMLMVSKTVDIWPERDVIKYIRSAIAVDGLISRFAPGFDVGGALQATCDRYLKWAARRKMFSYDRLLGAFLDSGNLATGGAGKLQELMDTTMPEGEHLPQPAHLSRPAPQGGPGRNLMPLAIVILLLAMFLSGRDTKVPGANFDTAALLLLAAGFVLFFGRVIKAH